MMERKIRKVQKWLERCLVACRSGSWENALAEIECANAEMETARKDLWAIVEDRGKVDNAGMASLFSCLLKGGILAMILIFVSAMPLSRLSITAFVPEIDKREYTLEFVSSEEEALLKALRRSLSNNGFRETAFTDQGQSNIISDGKKHVDRDGSQGETSPIPVTGIAVGENVLARDEKSRKDLLDMDKLITLVQVGEQALRESGPTIQIQTQR